MKRRRSQSESEGESESGVGAFLRVMGRPTFATFTLTLTAPEAQP